MPSPSSTGTATGPSNPTVTAIRVDTAANAAKTCRATAGRPAPSSTTVSVAAAIPAAISAAAPAPTATPAANTGKVPIALRTAIAAGLADPGSNARPLPTASTAARAQHTASGQAAGPAPELESNATNSGSVAAAIRAPCMPTQSRPSCTGSTAADSVSIKPISSRLTPSVMAGARQSSGTTISRPRCSESHRRANVSPAAPTAAASTSPTAAGTQS